jgi:hypothetical protein
VGKYVPGDSGWQTVQVVQVSKTAQWLSMRREFPPRIITGFKAWASATGTPPALGTSALNLYYYDLSGFQQLLTGTFIVNTAILLAWSGAATAKRIVFSLHLEANTRASGALSGLIASAQVAGLGANPFGADNCP